MHLGIPHLGLNAIGSLFGPASLFAGGAQGVWYDPSDFSALYQDSAGTTPVTAFEQPVGLLLDKSQGAAHAQNGYASGNFTNWTGGTNVSIAGGVVTANAAPRNSAVASVTSGSAGQSHQVVVAGQWYEAIVTVTSVTSGEVAVLAEGGSQIIGAITAPGTYRGIGRAGVTGNVYLWNPSGAPTTFSGTVTAITINQIAGNHASQATTTQRPVVTARYNLLTRSNAMESAPWAGPGSSATVTTDGTLNPRGALARLITSTAAGQVTQSFTAPATAIKCRVLVKAGNAALASSQFIIRNGTTATNLVLGTLTWAGMSISGAGATVTSQGGGWYLVEMVASSGITVGDSITFYTGSYTAAGLTYYVSDADARLPSDAALSIPAYQDVRTATDYATAGFPAYLKFDGVSNNLATGSVNWGTPKITAFSGVTKLSDATVGVIAGLSDPNVNIGSFEMRGPHANTTANYGGNYSGATAITGFASASSFAAPNSAVLTMPMDLGAPSLDVRVSGADQGQTNAATGGGNFGNFPIYIGARGGTSVYFNGRLYGLIVVGAAQPANTITFTERWLGQRMGIGL